MNIDKVIKYLDIAIGRLAKSESIRVQQAVTTLKSAKRELTHNTEET
jgi:hypothetical protein